MKIIRLFYAAFIIGAVLIFGVRSASSLESAVRLDIPPVYQQTPVWCWAAVGEMVFRYYGVPTINPRRGYQCGIVSGLGGRCWADCTACPVPAGQLGTIAAMIEAYPKIAAQMTSLSVSSLGGTDQSTPLTPAAVIEEIDSGRPIIAGISPSGMRYPPQISEHVALIIGYVGGKDRLTLIVNDPFPFREVGARDPYSLAGGDRVERGRYRIGYDSFVQRLQWNNTIHKIE